jgi:hypothetical protein
MTRRATVRAHTVHVAHASRRRGRGSLIDRADHPIGATCNDARCVRVQ